MIDREHHHEHHHEEGCNCSECQAEEKKEKLKLGAMLQDEAVVISAEYHTGMDEKMFGILLHSGLKKLAGKVCESGGMIGHIKASVESLRVSMYSITDVEVSEKHAVVPELKVHLAAILFLVTKENGMKMVRELFDDIEGQLPGSV